VADSTVITPHQQQVWATSDEATVGNTFSAIAHVWRTGNAHAGPCTPLPRTTTDEGVTRPPACEKTLGAPRGSGHQAGTSPMWRDKRSFVGRLNCAANGAHVRGRSVRRATAWKRQMAVMGECIVRFAWKRSEGSSQRCAMPP
jgi:hypothetical protein